MKIKVRRIKKGDVVPMQTGQDGYIPSRTEEKGYLITIGHTAGFVPDAVLKAARSQGEAIYDVE